MSAGTGARGPRRHASSSAALCTADVATPAVVPRPSSSRSARAPSSPPILASAVTASVWGGPCGIADPPGGERRLAPHHGLGVPERFTEQRRIEGAGIRCGEDPRELAHERLVRLLRGGAAAAERRCTEQDDDATGEPDQGSA